MFYFTGNKNPAARTAGLLLDDALSCRGWEKFGVLHQHGFEVDAFALLVNVHPDKERISVAAVVTIPDASQVGLNPKGTILEGSALKVTVEV